MKKANGVYPNRLDEYIQSQGYQKQEVAKAVGVSRNMLTHYLKGRYNVQTHVRERFAEVLGVSVTDLFPTSYLPSRGPSLSKIDTPAFFHPITQVTHQPPVTYTISVLSSPLPELDELDIMRSRRQVLQLVLNTACTTLMLSPPAFLHSDSLERLQKAVTNPIRIDKDVLSDLSSITGIYWRLCANASINLLGGISGHLTTVIDLLRESHSTPIYLQLCSLVAETAQILGKALYDTREYNLAWAYYTFSVKIAQEAQNSELWAVGLGRLALLLIYCGQPENALLLIQEALEIKIQNARINSWLAAIEAEIYATHKDYENYVRALDVSKNVVHGSTLEPDVYATGFGLSRLLGYEGACLLRIQKPEQALPILQQTLSTLAPTAIRRRATLYADIGKAYAQLGDVKNACLFALQALQVATQVKSLTTLQRIHTVNEELSPWENSAEVKNLNQQFALSIAAIGKVRDML